ncbi:MAG: histone-lysine N-methyltransferase [Deltaproteobacteria bacterium]|nr:MAG: histone-lysine N-methyltransferase [Deltaproteobacteria bacterium]
MARWDREKGILVHEPGKFWRYELRDLGEPNLYRDIFPYTEVPRIDFDHKILPISPADRMFITDTTFRDGQQSRPPYTSKQILDLYDLLHKLGGHKGIIRQCEFFLYGAKDKEAIGLCKERGYRYPEITGWIRAKAEDLKLLKDMGLTETGILTSVSDYHVFYKLGKTRKKVIEEYLGIVKSALNMGIVPRCHFEDITRADIYGFVVPYASELMRLREESRIDIKIRLCDTLGFGVTYPGAALPRSVPKLVRALIEEAGVPGELLEWHGHNDFHKALINATTAWLYGCQSANGTLLGFGERTGNTPVEGLIMEYINLRGNTDGIDTTIITDIANYLEKEMSFHVPEHYPFVGGDFNATRAGIHVDGLIKNEEVYNIFDTQKILKRPSTVSITDKSGTAGIVHWIYNNCDIPKSLEILKRHPGVLKINKKIQEEYDSGRVTVISNKEMRHYCQKYIPELFMSRFDILKNRASDMVAHLLEDLIENEDISSMDPAKQEPVMEKVLDDNPFIQFMYITDTNGRKVTRNICSIVDKAKFERFQLNDDFSNRNWFIGPMKDGNIHVTDFYTSIITGALCITVSGPIRDQNDEIAGIFGIDIKFEDLAKMEEDENEDQTR